MRVILAMTCVLALAACGGNRLSTGSTAGSTGPISRACLAADRSAATTSLCACVQRVANSELSSADQRKMVPFFADPERAHAVRISDTTANDAFWARYQDYVRSARARCGS